jgi:hypothetical protein
VDAGIEFFIGHIMTHSAVDLFQLLRMGELINGCIVVAIDTFHNLVYRTPISLEIHIEGYRPPSSFCGQFAIGMTGFAIFIALRQREAGNKKKEKQGNKKSSFHCHRCIFIPDIALLLLSYLSVRAKLFEVGEFLLSINFKILYD